MPSPYELWLADQKKKKQEQAQGKVRYREAAQASRPQYTLKGYQGSSKENSYKWETDMLKDVKKMGRSYNDKFSNVTKRAGMSTAEADDYRRYMDFQEDSKQKYNGNSRQNVRAGQGAHTTDWLMDNILNGMNKNMNASIQRQQNQKIEQNKSMQKAQKERPGFLGFLDSTLGRVGNAAHHVFGENFVKKENEDYRKLAEKKLKENPKDKHALQSLQILNKVDRPAENKTEKVADFIGRASGEIAPYTIGGAYGAADKLLNFVNKLKAIKNPIAKDLIRGGMAGAIAGSEKEVAKKLASDEKISKKDIAIESALAGGGDAALGALFRNLNLKGHLDTLMKDSKSKKFNADEFKNALHETYGQKGNVSNVLADAEKAMPKPFEPKYQNLQSTMKSFTTNDIPKAETPKTLDNFFDFASRGNALKARGAVPKANISRGDRELLGNQADTILQRSNALENAPDGGFNQRLLNIQREMKALDDKRGIYRPALNIDDLYTKARKPNDPQTFDELIKLAEMEDNVVNAPINLKNLLREDPRIKEGIQKLNALGGLPKKLVPPKESIPNIQTIDEMLPNMVKNEPSVKLPNGNTLKLPENIRANNQNPLERLQTMLSNVSKKESAATKSEPLKPGRDYEPIEQAKLGDKLIRIDNAPSDPLPNDYDTVQHIGELINREPLQKTKLTMKEKVKNILEQTYIKMVDDFYGGTRLDKASGRSLDSKESATMNAHLAKGAGEKARQELERGYFDAEGNKIGKGFNEIIQNSENPDLLETYLVARSILDYDAKGLTAIKSNGFDQKEIANRTIATIEAEHPSVQKEAEDMYEFINNQRNVLSEGSILNEAQIKAMDKENPNYIPMERFREDGIESFVNANEALKNRFANVGNPMKKRTGSEREIISPLQTLVKRQYIYNNMAERNKVGEAVLDNLEIIGKDNPFASIIEVEKNGAFKLVDAAGELANKTEKEIPESINGLFQKADGNNNLVYVYKNGDKYTLQIKDKFLYESMMSLNTKQLPGWMKVINYPTRMLRAGVTLSPDFGLRNLFRDQLTTAVTSKVGYKPFYDALKGAAEIIKARKGNSPIVDSYVRNGGSMSVLQNIDRTNIVKNYKDVVGDKTTREQLLEIAKDPMKWMEPLRKVGEFSEMSTRIGHYKKALKTGMDAKEATYLARSTMDFNRAGTWGRQINQGVAFFNAAIQGMDVLARSVKDRPVQTFKNIGLYVTLPTAALYMMNKDQDWYKEIPDDARDRNWYIPVGGQILQLPKPFEVGILFGAGLERTLDHAFNEQDSPYKDFAKQVSKSFTPDVIPTAVKPLIEVVTNHNFFTGESIESLGDKQLNPADRYNAYNSQVSIGLAKLAEKLNPNSPISPKQIDHSIRGYTGTLGSYVAEGIDDVAQVANSNIPKKPSRGVQTMPFVRSFFVKNLEGNNRSVNDFYNLQTKLRKMKKTATNKNQSFPYMEQKKKVEKVMSAINKLQKSKKEVLNSNKINSKEKADQLKTLNQQISELAKQGNAYKIK
jgi:hypothetical protein